MFWRIDLQCAVCGDVLEDFWQHKGDAYPPCAACRGPMGRVYLTFPSLHRDEIDYIDDNLGPTPIRIRSRAERKRLMKEKGLVEAVRHVGLQGSDKNPHTQRFL